MYQTTVHKEDDVTPKSFRRFLVDTPLLPERDMESAAQAGRATADAAWAEVDCAEHAGSACAAADRVMARLPDDGAEVADSCSVVATGLGSMHCLYRLDGKLVAGAPLIRARVPRCWVVDTCALVMPQWACWMCCRTAWCAPLSPQRARLPTRLPSSPPVIRVRHV